jgi:hypothetical protein
MRVLGGLENLRNHRCKTLTFSATFPPDFSNATEIDLESWKYQTAGLEKVKVLGEDGAAVVQLMLDPVTGLFVAMKAFKPREKSPTASWET